MLDAVGESVLDEGPETKYVLLEVALLELEIVEVV